MAINYCSCLFFCLLALITQLLLFYGSKRTQHRPFNRSSFPEGFIFGAGSAAYQINPDGKTSEGAANLHGRGPSVWDTFVKEHPEKILDHSTGDVADDFYHRYKDDVKLMKEIGLDSFRFSISWSRILPKGKISGGVNMLGVKFYNDLIDELLANGIEPFVTLFHFDTPQSLEDEYGSFLSPKIVDDFKRYADFCFETFGERVKLWATMNEPNIFVMNGYSEGRFAPGRCSKNVGNCDAGNSATEPYIALHHLLLCHAATVQLYKHKYQATQKGKIGITTVTHWFIPKDNTPSSRQAASRALDFFFGWVADPITFGDYPKSMRESVGSRLPNFTKEESKELKGSYDFLGLNYYTTLYAETAHLSSSANLNFDADQHLHMTSNRNGKTIGAPTGLDWLHVCPKGIEELLIYIKQNYNNPIIYINENGMPDSASLSLDVALKDNLRITYLSDHLFHVLKAIKDGVNVKGYFAWSFLDVFEWASGYSIRFGIVYVDYNDGQKRYLKDSAYWFKKFLLN